MEVVMSPIKAYRKAYVNGFGFTNRPDINNPITILQFLINIDTIRGRNKTVAICITERNELRSFDIDELILGEQK